MVFDPVDLQLVSIRRSLLAARVDSRHRCDVPVLSLEQTSPEEGQTTTGGTFEVFQGSARGVQG